MSTSEGLNETAVITSHFVQAVYRGAQALEAQAAEIERSKEFHSQESVGRILRSHVEDNRLTSAMLFNWAERHREQVGIEKLALGGALW